MATANHINDPSPAENWKPVVGWGGIYEVSDQGNVRSLPRTWMKKNGVERHYKGKVLKGSPYVSGHLQVNLQFHGKQYKRRVHRLVMEAFVGPCPDGMEVCHINGVPDDNRLVNLRYDTHTGNMGDKNDHGTVYQRKRTHCPRGHILAPPNLMKKAWEEDGHRSCTSCNRASAKVSTYPHLRPQFDEIADRYYAEVAREAG